METIAIQSLAICHDIRPYLANRRGVTWREPQLYCQKYDKIILLKGRPGCTLISARQTGPNRNRSGFAICKNKKIASLRTIRKSIGKKVLYINLLTSRSFNSGTCNNFFPGYKGILVKDYRLKVFIISSFTISHC